MLEREAMAILVSASAYRQRARTLKRAGSALEILARPQKYARELGEAGVKALLRAAEDAEQILERISEECVHLVALGEEGYPGLLAQIPAPPHLLYVQGEPCLTDVMPVAIVGTRRASEYGLTHTQRIARELASAGVCIVSGLATGIDAAAHTGALDVKGRTIAVLGGALDCFYPAENAMLREQILDCGGSIVSEYPMGIAPTQDSFLHRNRIIAGMSRGVLVTEGPLRSGALRTANNAADYGREVFALPGSVESSGSQMPHKLISEGAHLTTGAGDVLSILAPELAMQIQSEYKREENAKPVPAVKRIGKVSKEEASKPEMPKTPHPALTAPHLGSQERAVIEALAGGEMEFDDLCEKTQIDATALGAMLIELEMDGYVDSLGALRYRLSEQETL